MNINALVFEGYETLDLFGPVEALGRVPELELRYFSRLGGVVGNRHGVKIVTEPVANMEKSGVLLLPGGAGTRPLTKDKAFLSLLKELADSSEYCLSVCTGSALLACCGVLDGRRATSNKKALDWVKGLSDRVEWADRARWVVDGKFYTASGISAGIDMALGFVRDILGEDRAVTAACEMEYIWNADREHDQFARF